MLLQFLQKLKGSNKAVNQTIVLQQIAKAVPLYPSLSEEHIKYNYARSAYINHPTSSSFYNMLLSSNRSRMFNQVFSTNQIMLETRNNIQLQIAKIFRKPFEQTIFKRFLNLLPRLLILAGIYYFISSSLSIEISSDDVKDIEFGSMLNKNGTSVVDSKKMKLRFKDVIGIEEFKQQLTQIVDYLKHPQKYKKVGAKLPRGILLEGPPGTGKTLLAKALAGQAGCSFIYKSGADFDEMFVGVGAQKVRKLFQTARKKAPCIIFIDQIDSVAGKRSKYLPGVYRAALNQLLTEMDGFSSTDNIIVIGATNLAGSLDQAIKRPGRFDRTINIPLPDVKGRQQILDYYKSKVKIEKGSLNSIDMARLSVGFSGADLSNLVNIAVLNAVKNKRKAANNQDFEYAFDRVKMGIGRKSLTRVQQQIKKVAYHEAGHALISLLTPSNKDLHKITILPRGGAMGFTSNIPKDQLHMSKKQIQANIQTCLGGRAAEDIIYGDKQITTGCSSDLIYATQLAYNLVRSYGMQQDLTVMAPTGQNIMSDEFKYQIDTRVKQILDKSYAITKSTLMKNRKLLDKLVQGLLQHQTLDRTQVKSLINL